MDVKICDLGWLLTGTALPQLITTLLSDSVEIPVVSPGHTETSPARVDTRMAGVSQPLVIE